MKHPDPFKNCLRQYGIVDLRNTARNAAVISSTGIRLQVIARRIPKKDELYLKSVGERRKYQVYQADCDHDKKPRLIVISGEYNG
jgi:ribosomal protein S17